MFEIDQRAETGEKPRGAGAETPVIDDTGKWPISTVPYTERTEIPAEEVFEKKINDEPAVSEKKTLPSLRGGRSAP